MSSWQKQHLDELVEILSGFAFDSNRFADSGELPIVRIRDVIPGYSTTFYIGDYDPKYIIQDGDILIGMDGEFKRACWKGGNALLNQRVCRISVSNQDLDKAYLFHFLPGALKVIEDSTPFVTVKHLSVKNIRDIGIPLPPLEEQKRIADILNRAEALRAKRRATLAQLDELIKSVFIEMFGDLDENPKKWDIKKIGDIAEVKTGGTPSRDIEGYWHNATLPWVKTAELKENIIYETEEYISELGFQNSNVTLLPKGSILIAMYGQGKTRGRTAKLGIQVTTNQACAAILPSDKYDTDFLWTFLRLSYDALRNLGQGGNQPNLNLSMVKGFKVYIPPIENQKEFSKILLSIEKMRQFQQQSLFEIDDLFNSLMHEAFTGRLFSHQIFEHHVGNGVDL